MKTRSSNFELMRIVSMFFIVLYHFLIHGWMIANARGLDAYLVNFISAILVVHVNSFILLSGYFQYNKKMKASKFIKICLDTFIYSNILSIIFRLVFHNVSNLDMLIDMMPIPLGTEYWYIATYLILYLISPLLNRVIGTLNRKEHRNTITMLLIFLSVLPWLTDGDFYNVNNGFSIINFSILYIIGAYLHKYKGSLKVNKRWMYFAGFCLCLLLNFFLYEFSLNALEWTTSKTLIKIFTNFKNGFLDYSNPLIIMQSIFYLLWFSTLNIRSKKINIVASHTFGVYLISENRLIIDWLYNFLEVMDAPVNVKLLIYVTACSIMIFIICVGIDMIKEYLLKFVYTKKLQNKIDKKISPFDT